MRLQTFCRRVCLHRQEIWNGKDRNRNPCCRCLKVIIDILSYQLVTSLVALFSDCESSCRAHPQEKIFRQDGRPTGEKRIILGDIKKQKNIEDNVVVRELKNYCDNIISLITFLINGLSF